MTRIKILHIIKSLGRGGAEMLLPETLKLHDQHKFEFHYIYFLPWKDQMVNPIVESGGRVTCVSASNNISLIFKALEVAKYVRTHGIQLIHAHLPWAGVLARVVGLLTRVPVIYTEHNKQERYHWATRWLNLFTLNWAALVIPVSADVAFSILKNKSHLTTKLKTILNGVNTDHFTPGNFDHQAVRQDLGIPSDAPVIGTVAVFRVQKRLELWMDIAVAIRERHPNAHFIIVGDGPLKDILTKKLATIDRPEVFHFPGLATEVRPFLASMDIYMMTSEFEGLPLALLEAMAMELPVISTEAGGIKEVIRNRNEGILCEVKSPEKLIVSADTLITDPLMRRSIAMAGRKRVVTEFSMGKMVAELEDVYRTVLTTQTL